MTDIGNERTKTPNRDSNLQRALGKISSHPLHGVPTGSGPRPDSTFSNTFIPGVEVPSSHSGSRSTSVTASRQDSAVDVSPLWFLGLSFHSHVGPSDS